MNINSNYHTKDLPDNDESFYITNDFSLFYSASFPNRKETDEEIHLLLSTDINKCIELLTSLTKQYPDEPILAYYFAHAYAKTEKDEFRKQLEENNYRKFPHFPLIRYAYMDKCLSENKLMQAAAAIDYTFNIFNLYPKKPHFHLTEILLFQLTVARYFCKIKDFERAVFCITQLKRLNPRFPGITELQSIISVAIFQEHLSDESVHDLLSFEKENNDDTNDSNKKN